jgi:hypothetical protein
MIKIGYDQDRGEYTVTFLNRREAFGSYLSAKGYIERCMNTTSFYQGKGSTLHTVNEIKEAMR